MEDHRFRWPDSALISFFSLFFSFWLFYISVILSNADPFVTRRLLNNHLVTTKDPQTLAWSKKLSEISIEGCTAKINFALSDLPSFHARPGNNRELHKGQVNIPLFQEEWEESFQASKRGEIPEKLWMELYFQTAVDKSLCSSPNGYHHMSAFVQYVPYKLQNRSYSSHAGYGERRSWSDDDKKELSERVIEILSRYCDNIPEAVVATSVWTPEDIEKNIGKNHSFNHSWIAVSQRSLKSTPLQKENRGRERSWQFIQVVVWHFLFTGFCFNFILSLNSTKTTTTQKKKNRINRRKYFPR